MFPQPQLTLPTSQSTPHHRQASRRRAQQAYLPLDTSADVATTLPPPPPSPSADQSTTKSHPTQEAAASAQQAYLLPDTPVDVATTLPLPLPSPSAIHPFIQTGPTCLPTPPNWHTVAAGHLGGWTAFGKVLWLRLLFDLVQLCPAPNKSTMQINKRIIHSKKANKLIDTTIAFIKNVLFTI